jgi:hypothetical protein
LSRFLVSVFNDPNLLGFLCTTKSEQRAAMATGENGDGRQAIDQAIDEEAVIQNAWRMTGNLHVIADRLAFCRLRNEPPPAWAVEDLTAVANASVDIKPYAKAARSFVRYVAVCEGHYREGLPWDKAKEWAAEKLRGQPAEASAEWMMKEYSRVRKALRAAGIPDNELGYHWVDDLPD